MSAPDLTEPEFYQMAHAIGHPQSRGCSVHGGRNHYCTLADDPLWLGLVERGLAVKHRASLLPDGEATFHVTDDGRKAIEADPRSIPPGHPYSVRFKGSPHSVQVRASTRGKAKYAAVLAVIDAWNLTAREAFKQIESCRQGYWP
jgi:hypothetical protein